MITSIKGLEYGGKYHRFFWDLSYNPLATIPNCLANCTTFVIGDILVDGLPIPVSHIGNANTWHLYLTNGWTLHDFEYSKVKVGDVIEWTNGCHVARVTKIDKGQIYISGSFYTGIHGKATWDDKFDTRDGLNSLKEVSDFMITNYPTRFFHHWEIENENIWVKDSPRYILRPPTNIVVEPVERNESRDQIEVLTNQQYIRTNNNVIVGVAQKGYYNVLDIKHSTKNTYDWYEVADDRYIGGVEGRVIFLKAENTLEALKKENAQLKADMQRIYKIIERWL